MCGKNYWVLTPETRQEKIFVFDETYVDRNVKIQSSGLDAIVLLGEQVKIEQQIQLIEQDIEQKTEILTQQETDRKKYDDINDVQSPQYWVTHITKHLQAPGGWAETAGRKIKGNKTNARVNEEEIDRIGQLHPAKSSNEIEAEFQKTYSLFSSINLDSQPVSTPVKQIIFSSDIESRSKLLLGTQLKRPVLTERESELLDTFGMKIINDAKGFLVNPIYKTCPVCLQSISDEYRTETIQRIERILNKDVEEFRQELSMLLINEIPTSTYQPYIALGTVAYEQVIKLVGVLNETILTHNAAIQAKIDDPFSVLLYDNSIGLAAAYQNLNAALGQLEEARLSYNGVIASRKKAERTLIRLNDERVCFEIEKDYKTLCHQREAKRTAAKLYQDTIDKIRELKTQHQQLDAQRKNFQIAADQINKSLEYIFYSRDRLKLELGADQLYHLKSRGQPVKPEQISCGERNALALCYYFTEIAKDTDARNMYSSEVLLIIDDPVSSFDLENRVGIISFLRLKLAQVFSACETTKGLIMTHDISVLLDLDKALGEIVKECDNQKLKTDYYLFQLKGRRLELFPNERSLKYNEYTALLQQIYAYAKNSDPDQHLIIGNMMRRALEAFSTFLYKKGINDISLDARVLALLPDDNSRTYFQNSMYRLVLNGESHFEEAVRCAPEMTFYSHLSDTEKQRTARDVLCFLYKINELHLLSHLPDAKNDLESWWETICS